MGGGGDGDVRDGSVEFSGRDDERRGFGKKIIMFDVERGIGYYGSIGASEVFSI